MNATAMLERVYPNFQPVRRLTIEEGGMPKEEDIVFFETLARAQRDDGSAIPIGQILSLFRSEAEKRALAFHMIRFAVAFLAAYPDKELSASVNIHPGLIDETFVREVLEILDSKAFAGKLILELLEDEPLPETSWHWVWVLWKQGVMFAVDDHPKDFSDMGLVAVLLNLRISFIVKIDKSERGQWDQLFFLQNLLEFDRGDQFNTSVKML